MIDLWKHRNGTRDGGNILVQEDGYGHFNILVATEQLEELLAVLKINGIDHVVTERNVQLGDSGPICSVRLGYPEDAPRVQNLLDAIE